MDAETVTDPAESGTGGVEELQFLDTNYEAPEAEEPEQQPAASEPESEPEKATFDEDAVGRIVGGILEKMPKQQATPPPEKEYTQEELDKMFNVYKPDENVINGIMAGGEDAVRALVTFRDGLLKQFNTLTEYRVQTAIAEMKQQFGPLQEQMVQQQQAREAEEFYKERPELKDHADLVALVVSDFKANNRTFESVAAAKKAIADTTLAVLKKRGIVPAAPNGSGQPQQTKMATLARGATAGAGTPRPTATGVAGDLKAIFG